MPSFVLLIVIQLRLLSGIEVELIGWLLTVERLRSERERAQESTEQLKVRVEISGCSALLSPTLRPLAPTLSARSCRS
jgi:hypothetical protein